MSDTSRVQLAYIAETEYGAQKTGSNLQLLRLTGESLRQEHGTTVSNEIRSDRQRTNVRRTRISASGAVNAELSYGTYDDLLAAALLSSAWSSLVTVGPVITISAAVSDNSFNDSGSGFGSLVANQWINVTGFTTAANNGLFKIVTVAAGKITVSGGTLADEVAGDSVTIKMGPQIVNGTTLATFNLERKYTDLASELSLFLGMAANQLTLNVPIEGVVTASFEFTGKSEGSIAASGGAGYDAATTSDPFSALDVTAILENQAAMEVVGFSLALNNNLRTRMVVGGAGVVSVGQGPIDLTGGLQGYYDSKTLYDKFLDETASSLALCLTDPAGNKMIVDIPQLKFTATPNGRNADGPSGDVMTDVQFTAYRDATEDVTLRIAQFAA